MIEIRYKIDLSKSEAGIEGIKFHKASIAELGLAMASLERIKLRLVMAKIPEVEMGVGKDEKT